MEDCIFCKDGTPREFIVSESKMINHDDSIRVSASICGNKLYARVDAENFSSNYIGSDELCNEDGDLELQTSVEIKYCPMCGKKL